MRCGCLGQSSDVARGGREAEYTGSIRRADRRGAVLAGRSVILFPAQSHVAELLVCRGGRYHPEESQSVRQQLSGIGTCCWMPANQAVADRRFEVTYTKNYHYWEFAIFILLGVFGVSFAIICNFHLS